VEHNEQVQSRTQPILVVMDYRGSDRFRRCLDSVRLSEHLFSRVILSITAPADSEDMQIAEKYVASMAASGTPSKAEVLCTEVELPTMAHQAFWVDYLKKTGARGSDWIYWLAYDDQVRVRGVEALVDSSGAWPLQLGTAYFGPWAIRHEQAEELYSGPWDEPLESWTSFPIDGPTRLGVTDWITQQLRQPTYMQMSGSVCTFESYLQVRDGRPRKSGPMRIEMAVAAATCNQCVEEFAEPVSIIYGRSNSDRASYGSAARKEDAHLLAWLGRYAIANPTSIAALTRGALGVAGSYAQVAVGRSQRVEEDWVVRGTVLP
jgi:hypothetical protein